jgi:hypothetical protein
MQGRTTIKKKVKILLHLLRYDLFKRSELYRGQSVCPSPKLLTASHGISVKPGETAW